MPTVRIFKRHITLDGHPRLIQEPLNAPPREVALPSTPDGTKELGYYVPRSSKAGDVDAPMACTFLTFDNGQHVRLPLYTLPPETTADQASIRFRALNIGLSIEKTGQADIEQLIVGNDLDLQGYLGRLIKRGVDESFAAGRCEYSFQPGDPASSDMHTANEHVRLNFYRDKKKPAGSPDLTLHCMVSGIVKSKALHEYVREALEFALPPGMVYHREKPGVPVSHEAPEIRTDNVLPDQPQIIEADPPPVAEAIVQAPVVSATEETHALRVGKVAPVVSPRPRTIKKAKTKVVPVSADDAADQFLRRVSEAAEGGCRGFSTEHNNSGVVRVTIIRPDNTPISLPLPLRRLAKGDLEEEDRIAARIIAEATEILQKAKLGSSGPSSGSTRDESRPAR